MFTKLNPNWLESSEGYVFRIISPHKIVYMESTHALLINSDPLTYGDGKYGLAVYVSEIEVWNPPYEKEVIDNFAINKIKGRISESLIFLSIPYRFC